MHSCRIESCTVSDAAVLARNNMSAYWTDSTWRLLWRNRTLEDIITQNTKRLPTVLLADRMQKRHLKAVDAETKACMGYARWVLPERLTGEWIEAQIPAVNANDETEYAKLSLDADWIKQPDSMDLGRPLDVIMSRLMNGKEYLELEYLAVHPDHKGQGIATMLVEHGIAVAEELEVDIIVMAYKAAFGVYKRLGFEMLEYLIQDDSKYGGQGEFGAYFMVRKMKRN